MNTRSRITFVACVVTLTVGLFTGSLGWSQADVLGCSTVRPPGQDVRRRRPASDDLENYLRTIGSLAERKRAIERILSSWLECDRAGVLAWVAGLSDETIQAEVAQYLVPLILKDNPGSAANLAASLSSQQIRHALLVKVLEAWTAADWDAGLAWAQRLPESRIKEEALIHLSYRWLEVDPREAVDYAASLSSCNSQLLATLAGQWAMRDPSAAADWAANLSDIRLRKKILPSLVAAWSQQSPSDAANFVANLPADAAYDETLISVVSSWSRQDPQSASSWLSQFPDSSLKQRAMEQIATVWASTDPQATVDWLQAEAPSDSRDAAIASYSNVVAQTSPEGAFHWAEQIRDEGVRDRQLEFLGRKWLRIDRANAQGAIWQSSLPDEQKKKLTSAGAK